VPPVIEISGPSAVGKTTMIGALGPAIDAVVVPEVFQGTTFRLPKPNGAADFLQNQLWLLDRVSDTYVRARRRGGPATYLVDSGIADILSFAKHFPLARDLDWDVLDALARSALGRERRLGLALSPDVILYLGASHETICARRGADTATSRRDHAENALLLPYEEAYFRRLADLHPGTVFVLDAETSREEILGQAIAAVDSWREAWDKTRTRLGVADMLRALGWEGEGPTPLPLTDRLAAGLDQAVGDVRQALGRLGPARLNELLRHVSLSDKEMLAVLEREVAQGALETDGRSYWLDGDSRGADSRSRGADSDSRGACAEVPETSLGRLAATLFNPHYAMAATAGATLTTLQERAARFSVLQERLARLFDGRPLAETGYDQRHVTTRTSLLRALYLLHRGDLAGKRVVLLGDDDLTSLALALVGGAASLTVLEIDERLVGFLGQRLHELETPEARVLAYDANGHLPEDLVGSADTFLCDPSRPLYDLFLERGREALKPGGALYTFLFPSHSSPAVDHDFLRRAMTPELALTDLIPAFGEYRRYPETLPPEFAGRYPVGDSPDDTICFTESLVRFVRG